MRREKAPLSAQRARRRDRRAAIRSAPRDVAWALNAAERERSVQAWPLDCGRPANCAISPKMLAVAGSFSEHRWGVVAEALHVSAALTELLREST